MARPTVREVWRLALPPGTRLAAGETGLSQPVQWARRMSAFAPAFAALEAQEMALLEVEALAVLDERLTLTRVVEALAEREAAALAAVGQISAQARAACDARGLPLLALPPEADLRDVERDVVRLIVEQEAQLDRRGRQVYRRLAQLSLEDRGLPAIAQGLLEITGKPAIVQDPARRILAQAWPEECALDPEQAATALADGVEPERWLAGRRLDAQAPPHTVLPLVEGWERAVAAIVTEGDLDGYLSLLGREGAVDELDRLAVERGALVCAVEMAKRRAVEATEDRMRGDFLDLILTAGPAEERALARRSSEMGYDLEAHHAVVIFAPAEGASTSLPPLASEFRARLINTGIHTLLGPHEETLVALCSAEEPAPLRQLDELAQAAQEHLGEAAPEESAVAGVGRPGPGLAGLRRSFIQAREALTLAGDLFCGARVLHFNDLGVYRLLCSLQGSEELVSFLQQTLGPLASYDETHGTELVATLAAFFEHHGNVSQTAQSLFLHRNSLLYRLERIGEITGLDLDDADERFALQLALKIRPLIER